MNKTIVYNILTLNYGNVYSLWYNIFVIRNKYALSKHYACFYRGRDFMR